MLRSDWPLCAHGRSLAKGRGSCPTALDQNYTVRTYPANIFLHSVFILEKYKGTFVFIQKEKSHLKQIMKHASIHLFVKS